MIYIQLMSNVVIGIYALQKTHNDSKEKEPDQYHCPVCNKELKCRYGLETHLETHTDLCIKCQTCNLTFSTPRDLTLHKLITHSRSKSDDEKCNGIKSSLEVGFYELSFVDFSVEKFSMIAKSWCEKNPRRPSSMYHDFSCKDCSKAFPSSSALSLHSNLHNPEQATQCPLCDCDFIDNEKLRTHMLKHLSEKALADCQKSFNKITDDEDSDVLKPDSMAKPDFFAMFDLKASDKKPEETPDESIVVKQEKEENNDYFAKLGQVFSASVSSLSPFSPLFNIANLGKDENGRDLANIQHLLQVVSGLKGLPSTCLPQILDKQFALQDRKSSLTSLPQSESAFSSTLPPNASSVSSLSPISSVNVHVSSLNSTPPTTPPASDSGNGSSGSLHESKLVNGMLPCKYCYMVFPNFRALKGECKFDVAFSLNFCC